MSTDNNLPNGGVISSPVQSNLVPCPEACECPPPVCYTWCIKRVDECVFQATSGDGTILMADSELSLASLIKAASINTFVNTTEQCKCPMGTNSCSNKTYQPFACVSRQWIVQVEYRPDCNQYFGSCNPKKVCNNY
jgi:hypothetical protein